MFNIKLYDYSPKSGMSLYELDLFITLESIKKLLLTQIPLAVLLDAQLNCVTKKKEDINIMDYDYDNIMSLAKKNNFKKIMIMRNSWGDGNWCIVNKVFFKPDGIYGNAYGHIHYKNGNVENGLIPCSGTYAWRVIKVLDEDLEIIGLKKKGND